MDFEDSPAEAAFRKEVRAWLEETAPRFAVPNGASDAEKVRLVRAWTAEKAKAGYCGFILPRSLGGRGGDPIEEVIFLEEQARVAVPHIETFNLGPGTALPVLMKHAHPEHVRVWPAPRCAARSSGVSCSPSRAQAPMSLPFVRVRCVTATNGS